MRITEITKIFGEKSRSFKDLKPYFNEDVTSQFSQNLVDFINKYLPESKNILASIDANNAFKETIKDFIQLSLEKDSKDKLSSFLLSIFKIHFRKNIPFSDFSLTYMRLMIDILNLYKKYISSMDLKLQREFIDFVKFLLIIYSFFIFHFYQEKSNKSQKDYLTNSYTKHYFFYNYKKLFKDYKYLIYFDLKNFKEMNLYYGYSVGDTIISIFSSVLETVFPKEVIVRYAPDDFIVFSNTRINFLVKKILKILKLTNEETKNIPTKYGFSNIPVNFHALILRCKDIQNLSLSEFNWIIENKIEKLKSKNKFLQFLEKEEIEKCRESYNFILKVIENLKTQNVKVALQGIYSLDGKLLFKEALARIDLNGKLITPLAFIDKSKDTAIDARLDRIVIEKVINFLIKNNFPFKISINTSSRFFDLYIDWFRNVISSHDKLKEYLIVEIVERNKLDEIKNVFNILKNLNLNVLIDDFGSSYSNYDFLKALSLDGIKIDGNIIKNIGVDFLDRNFVECIVQIAKAKNMQVIAEYVESEDIIKTLRDLSKSLNYKNIAIQGFIFEKPQVQIN